VFDLIANVGLGEAPAIIRSGIRPSVRATATQVTA
jgi:hypothetical protein